MKRANPQKRLTRTEITPSNNKNNKKHITVIEEDGKELLSHKAGLCVSVMVILDDDCNGFICFP